MTDCSFPSRAEGAAAAAELQALTQIPSLLALQKEQLKQLALREPAPIRLNGPVNQIDARNAIALVLDMVDDEDFEAF